MAVGLGMKYAILGAIHVGLFLSLSCGLGSVMNQDDTRPVRGT